MIVLVTSFLVAILSLFSTLLFIGFDAQYAKYDIDCEDIDVSNTRNVYLEQW